MPIKPDDPEPIWDKPNEVPQTWIETVDEHVVASQLYCMMNI